MEQGIRRVLLEFFLRIAMQKPDAHLGVFAGFVVHCIPGAGGLKYAPYGVVVLFCGTLTSVHDGAVE